MQSITRTAPVGSPTNATTITYSVTFTEPVTGVDPTDFKLATTGTVAGTVSQVTGSGTSYTVTVSSIAGDGTLGLNLFDDNSIRDLAGNPLGSLATIQSMAPANNYATNLRTDTAAAADFDSDGKIDVAVTDSLTSTFGVLLGNGNGTLKPVKNLTGLDGADTILTADMNGDGIPDLIESSPVLGEIAVLLGNGNATFKPLKTYAVDTRLTKIAIADHHGDGRLDVVATSYANEVSVFLGNGDGTLRPRTTLANGHSAFVLVADITGDGVPDLVVSNPRDNTGLNFVGTISTFVGNGDGTFKPRTAFNAVYPAGFALGDVNGDGKLDLITSDYGMNSGGVVYRITSATATVRSNPQPRSPFPPRHALSRLST